MCGIAGVISLDGRPAEPARLEGMIRTLVHRGPDDRGVFATGAVGLAAARLSIIDIAGGHQPISIADGGITVAQNGEIYNHVELREQLVAISVPSPVQIRLELRNGRVVIWGDDTKSARKSTVATVLLKQKGAEIDVSAVNVVTIR